jgi:glucokinase
MSENVAKHGKVSGRTAFDEMRAGDAAAREVVEMYVDYLAEGLANMINIFQPEVLSIGGGVSGEGQFLLDMLVPMVNSRIYGKGIVKIPEIKVAQLKNDAGIVGGAVLGVKA